MASRITYNSKTIDFTKDAMSLEFYPVGAALSGTSVSGITETLKLSVDCPVTVFFRNFDNRNAADITLKRNLYQWKQWAEAGQAWSFAWDSAEAVITTLANPLGRGASILQPANIYGITAGNTYVLRDAVNYETIKVSTIDGLNLILTEPLNEAYTVGARLRSEKYWPALLRKCEIIENPPLFWNCRLTFSEDMTDIIMPFVGMPPWMQTMPIWKRRLVVDQPHANNNILPV